MNAFTLSGLLAGVSSFSFGLLVLLKSDNKKIGRVWFVFSLAVALWGFGSMLIGLNTDPEKGLLLWRLAHGIGVVWIPPLFVHFVNTITNESSRSLKLHYLTALVFMALVPTPYFYKDAILMFDSFVYSLGGKAYSTYCIWWFGLTVWSHLHLLKAYRTAATDDRNRIKYFFLATSLGYVGGAMCFIPSFGIDIFPWGNFAICVYPLIMYYAILKYRLMDIRIFMRRAGLLLTVYAMLILLSAPVVYYLHQRSVGSDGISTFILGIEVVFLGVVLSLGPFVYAYLIQREFWLKGHLSKGFTHELKSPLSAIQGASELISANPSNLSEYLDIIQKNTARLESFTTDLLRIARIQEGNFELEKTRLNFSRLVSEEVENHRSLAQLKNISIEYDAPTDVELTADAAKLRQIISNLLSNSMKFTPVAGKIEITIESSPSKLVKFTISDSGSGIAPNNLQKIFDRFYQGKNASKGSGLGLSIAKAWVEAHDGKIWAESDGEGKGMKVIFTLPNV